MIARVDGMEVAAGNDKLMDYLGVTYIECHAVGTIIHMAIDGKYAGHIVISDIVKPHSQKAIDLLRKVGVKKTVMLTGDAKKVARWGPNWVWTRSAANCFPLTRWRRWRS